RERDARALPAGERSDGLALRRAVEEEPFEVASNLDRAAAEVDPAAPLGHVFEDGGVLVEGRTELLEVSDAGALAEDDLASARRDLSRDGTEQRRLAGAVRTDDPDPLAAPDEQIELPNEQRAAERQRQASELQDRLRGGGRVDGDARRALGLG